MTDIDFSVLKPEVIVGGIPDHKASAGSGETGEPTKARPGIFGAATKRGPGRPRKTITGGDAPKREVPPKLSAGMKGQLEDLYSGIGALIKPFDELTGETIIEQAPKCAKTVYDLAQTNDSVRRFVIMLTTTSVTGALIIAHLPIILALMRHVPNEQIANTAKMGLFGIKMSNSEAFKNFANKDQPTEDDAYENGVSGTTDHVRANV